MNAIATRQPAPAGAPGPERRLRRVFVTGGSGFVGGRLLRDLAAAGVETVAHVVG